MKTNSNSVSELKSRPAQRNQDWGQSQMVRIDLSKRNANRQLPTDGVLKLLQQEAPLLLHVARVVGQWVWIQFEEKQPREITSILSQVGFHWNKRRQLWQHPCGVESQAGTGNYDPRERYGNRVAA